MSSWLFRVEPVVVEVMDELPAVVQVTGCQVRDGVPLVAVEVDYVHVP